MLVGLVCLYSSSFYLACLYICEDRVLRVVGNNPTWTIHTYFTQVSVLYSFVSTIACAMKESKNSRVSPCLGAAGQRCRREARIKDGRDS